MTTQPTTGPTAADTTTSARETLHHLAHLTADPYIPEAHDDEDELYRDDVRDVLAAHGWTEGPDGFLRKGGALWTETNKALDSGLDGPGGQYVIEFTSEVPAPVITAACLTAAGADVAALPAEVDRLRAERNALRERVAELEAERATTRADRDAEIMAWLLKKAREYRSTGGRQRQMQARAVETMASKIARGAVRANNTRGGAA